MKASSAVLLLALSLILLSGCASDSPSTDLKPIPKTGLLIEPLEAQRIGYQVAWAGSVATRGDIRSVTVLGDLIVIVEEPNNMVSALSARDGSLVWAYRIDEASSKLFRPIRRDENIYVASPTRMYTLAAADGALRSIAELDEVLACDPLLIDRLAICGSIDGTVFAHDVVSGFTKWSYDLTARIEASPVEAGLNAFVGDANGVYAMLVINETNHLVWRGRTFDAIRYPAAVDRLNVFVASQDQRLYALNRATGREKWKLPMDRKPTGPPTAIGLNIYLPVSGEQLLAVDAIEGNVKWKITAASGPVTGNEERLLLSGMSWLRLIDAVDGQEIATAATKPLHMVIAGPDNSVILISDSGQLVRLNPSS